MTLDELIELTESIVDGMTMSTLRQGQEFMSPNGLSDRQFALLVRFIAGERPTAGPAPTVPGAYEPGLPRGGSWVATLAANPEPDPVWPEDNPALKTPPPPPSKRRPERDRSVRQLELSGDFEGIVLP